MYFGGLFFGIEWIGYASKVGFIAEFESFIALACIWCNTCAIHTSIVIFSFRITDWMAYVGFALIVAKSIADITFAFIWINAKPIGTLFIAAWLTQIIVSFAHFEPVHTNASKLRIANAIDAVACFYLSSIAIGWIIDARLIHGHTIEIFIFFEAIVAFTVVECQTNAVCASAFGANG